MLQILLLGLVDEVPEQALLDVLASEAGVIGPVQLYATAQIFLQVLAELAALVTQYRVPVVFDGIIRAAKDHIRDLSPAILAISLQYKEDPALFYAPRALL